MNGSYNKLEELLDCGVTYFECLDIFYKNKFKEKYNLKRGDILKMRKQIEGVKPKRIYQDEPNKTFSSIYALFLKVKYQNELDCLENFYSEYKKNWAIDWVNNIFDNELEEIEKSILKKELSADQRRINRDILNHPNTVISFYMGVKKGF